MPPLNRNRFLILAATVSIFLTAPAAAINLEPVDNNRVWLNEDARGQLFEATCGDGYERNLYLNGSDFSVQNSEVTNSDLREKINDGAGVYNLTLNCFNKTGSGKQDPSNQSELMEAVKLVDASDNTQTFEVENWGRGFLGGKLENGITWGVGTQPSTNSEAVSFDLSVEGGDAVEIFQDDFSDNFEFGDSLTLPEDGVDAETVTGGHEFILNPNVNSYFDTTEFRIEDEEGDLIVEREADPNIYEWTAELVGGENPTRRMNFQEAMNGEYNYLLELEKISDEQNILDPNDFVLTVLVRSKENSDYVSVDELNGVDEMEDEEWLEWSEPGGEVGTHRVTLDNVKALEGLPDRQYKFLLTFDRENYDEFVIDQVLVDKQSEFSGRVVDTKGSGMEAMMKLRNPDRNVRIGTGQDGYYSEEINSDAFDSMVIDFYKRGKLSPDSSVVIDEPSVAGNSDLGRGGSAVKFDYWSDPNVDITGVDPVNMMAVKFGYPINSFDSANVKFDPSGINPENLQVYECSFWNFEGSSCLGSWEQIGDNGFSVNMGISPPDVHISELEPYTTPDEDGESQDILMNSYVLGTSADIGIRDTLTIGGQTDGRIKRGGSLEFSGFIEDQKGNLVSEGIPVEVTLEKPDNSESYDGETDSNGKFVIGAEAPDEPGNYTVSLSSEPDIYDGFSIEYSRPLSVYTEREVSLDVPDSFTMQKGEEKVMEFEVRNTGQADLTVDELIADGMSTDFFSWVEKVSGEIEPGESRTAEIRFDLPDAYTDSYPSLGLRAVASSGGQTVESSTTAQIRARDVVSGPSGQESEENDSENTTQNQSSQDFEESSPGEDLSAVTGNFIQSTSNVNLALGLLMILMMIVAGAVRKKKDDAGNRRGSRRGDRGRPQVGGMNVSPQKDEGAEEDGADQEDLQDEDEVEEGEKESEESEEEEEKFVDEETGKEFDTKEALELFQEMQD